MNTETAQFKEESGNDHGNLRSYVLGFLFSVAFTLLPYFMVTLHLFTKGVIVVFILSIALLQLLVQLVYFLHLNGKLEQRWNLVIFAFTFLIVLVVGIGSLWIMHHLDQNMMSGAALEKTILLDEAMDGSK